MKKILTDLAASFALGLLVILPIVLAIVIRLEHSQQKPIAECTTDSDCMRFPVDPSRCDYAHGTGKCDGTD